MKANGALNATGRVLAQMIVGGTTSAMTGGKFANGAITAAFVAVAGEMKSSGSNMVQARTVEEQELTGKDLSSAERKVLFDQLNSDVKAKIKQQHKFQFENKYAVGIDDGNGTVDVSTIKEFDTLQAASKFRAMLIGKGLHASHIAGATAAGTDESTIYAGAIHGRTLHMDSGADITLSAHEAGMFTMLHEYFHGHGGARMIGYGGNEYVSEAGCDDFALKRMGLN